MTFTDAVRNCEHCEPDDDARWDLQDILMGDLDAEEQLCSTHLTELERGSQRYAVERHGIELPEDHPWRAVHHRNDRGAQICRDCNVIVPVTSGDMQAGIRLYCPECLEEMGWAA